MGKLTHRQAYQEILKLLRKRREEAELTQSDLARRIGCTQSFVSKCERGERRLDLVEVRQWCYALDLSFPKFARDLDDILGGLEKREKAER
jgi:transcriptional regulator with XRE-family HTH domain